MHSLTPLPISQTRGLRREPTPKKDTSWTYTPGRDPSQGSSTKWDLPKGGPTPGTHPRDPSQRGTHLKEGLISKRDSSQRETLFRDPPQSGIHYKEGLAKGSRPKAMHTAGNTHDEQGYAGPGDKAAARVKQAMMPEVRPAKFFKGGLEWMPWARPNVPSHRGRWLQRASRAAHTPALGPAFTRWPPPYGLGYLLPLWGLRWRIESPPVLLTCPLLCHRCCRNRAPAGVL